MNSEHEQLEIQITALLLGELPEAEAAALLEKIAGDAELSALQERLKFTIGLVEEAVASQTADLAAPEELQLSAEKRERLLAAFKTIEPVEFAERRVDFRGWIGLAAMVAALLAVAFFMLPEPLRKARLTALSSSAALDDEMAEDRIARLEAPTRGWPAAAATPPEKETEARYYYRFDEEAKNRSDVQGRVLGRVELPKLQEAAEPRGELAQTDLFAQKDSPPGGVYSVNAVGYVDVPVQRQMLPPFSQGGGVVGGGGGRGFGNEMADEKKLNKQPVALAFGVDKEAAPGEKAVVANGAVEFSAGGVGGIALNRPALQTRGARSESLRELGETDVSRSSVARESSLATVTAGAPFQSVKPGAPAAAAPAPAPMPAPARDPRFADRLKSYAPGLTPTEGRAAGAQADQLRRQLETQEKMRDSVKKRVDEENLSFGTTDRARGMVDRAEEMAGKSPTIMERLRGVERSARVEVAKDLGDVSPLMAMGQAGAYDPYFLQTEQEKFKSQKVLNGVVAKLNLNEAWADRFGGGQPLSTEEAQQRLRKMIDVGTAGKSGLVEIKVKSDRPDEAARIANTVADVYLGVKAEEKRQAAETGIKALEDEVGKQEQLVAALKQELQKVEPAAGEEAATRKPISNAAIPQPEIATSEDNFSTFSLNVSDVSFKLAAASLEKGQMPEPATVRSEEFINAFDYRDPAPAGSAPLAFAWERARYPFAHDRELLRFSVKTAASGREAGRPLNLVLLLDNSGSMERADRVRIIQECMRALGGQLGAQDKVSVVSFARTARLWVDGLPGSSANELATRVGTLTPEGGTNLEEAMRVAYETAARHFVTNGVNRVVLLTDGAANLGDVQPESLKKKVEANRKAGIALDCFGIGWDGLNDDLLEQLSRNGDGRYGFVNTPEAARAEFAGQLAGALKVAASDVKMQVEFNPKRATIFRQIGYAKHQLTKEQFRDNSVDAAEIGAAEAGNALYIVQTNPAGEGPIATVRARFKIPGTNDYREHEWAVPYEGAARTLEQSNPTLRLAAAASGFSEWLAGSPYAAEITPNALLNLMGNVPEAFANDGRPKQLEWMIRQAKSIAGK